MQFAKKTYHPWTTELSVILVAIAMNSIKKIFVLSERSDSINQIDTNLYYLSKKEEDLVKKTTTTTAKKENEEKENRNRWP